MKILSVSPNGLEQGNESDFIIRGEGFVDGATVAVSGTGTGTINVAFLTTQTLQATIEADPTATVGLRDVTVTLPDASTATLANSLLITNFQTLTGQLRRLIGERIPAGKSDTDTEFTNDELIEIISKWSANLYLAASEAWAAKAAEYAKLVDINESGSERKLSQMFKQANVMAETYNAAGNIISQELIMPVVGVSVAWLHQPNTGWQTNLSNDPFGDPFVFLANAQRPWGPVTIYWVD